MKFGHLNELRYTNWENKLSSLYKILCALNPSTVLTRGYSFIKVPNRLITSYEDFQALDSETVFDIHFKDGLGKGKKV